MEELSITRNRDEKLSKPLIPNDIPVKENSLKACNNEDFQDVLNIEPKEGLFFYLKIPGLIFGGVIAGYIIGRLKFSIVNIFIIAYIIFFVYNRKVKKFTRSLKSLIYYNTKREKIRNCGETVEWLNYIFRKVWKVVEPVVSSQIYQEVNNKLLKITPPFLNGLRLVEFTLGSRPPSIEGVSYMNMDDDNTLAIEADVAFIPLETSKDAANYLEGNQNNWNLKIQLSARVGTKNGIGINLPILVKELFFRGKIRIIVSLIQKNIFVKNVEVCLMDKPGLDFTLVPLKTVDIMDIPGLSKWIKNVITSILSTTIINPNSINIDLEAISKDKGELIGIICLQILNLENEENKKLTTEIDVDGRVSYQTKYKEGKKITYNEYFYIPVEDVDMKIGLSVKTDSNNAERRNGSIFLKNLPLCKNEELPNSGMYEPRRTFFNKVRLVKDEQSHSFMNTNLQFYPISEKKCNSGIIKMTLIGIEDLLGNKASKFQTYSTFCTIIVSPINRDEASIPIGFVENTVSAAAFFVSGIVNTAESMITKVIPGSETTNFKLLPSSDSTFYVFESKRVFGSNSPLYNEDFSFFCRDISVDVVSVCVMNDKTNEVIGRASVPVRDIHFNKKEKYKLNDAQSGRLELMFNINYIDMVDKAVDFINYERIMKISVSSTNEKGIYYIIFETNTDAFRMETFASVLPIRRNAYIPLQKTDSLKFKLYKETINGDMFIGEDSIDCGIREGVTKEVFFLNEQTNITFNIEEAALKDYSGAPEDRDVLKVIQVKFGEFINGGQEMFIEFMDNDEIIRASGFTRRKRLNDVFTFLLGSEEIHAVIKKGAQSSDKILGKCAIPKRFLNERVLLNQSGFSVDMEIRTQKCPYKPDCKLKIGYLEVYVKNCKDIVPAHTEIANTYCRILINENKVYQTKVVRKNKDPIFNESFIIEINKIKDNFGIQVYDTSEKDTPLCYTEFPLYNLYEGFSETEFELFDGKTFQLTNSKIIVGFNFYSDQKTLSIKKRGIISNFFGL